MLKLERVENGGGLVELFTFYSKRALIGPDAVVLAHGEIFGSPNLFGHTLVNNDARVHDNANITSSYILGKSEVYGNADIRNSFLLDESRVSGLTTVKNSVVKDRARIIDSAWLDGALIERDATISQNAMVYGATVTDFAYIEGDAILEGDFTVGGITRIHEGTWTRAPHVVRIPDCFSMVECKHGNVIIGCQCRPIALWRRAGRRIFEKYYPDMKPEHVELYYKGIKEFE